MTSKEALERLSKYNNHYVKDKEYFLIDVESEEWKAILRDLKEKEKQDKIINALLKNANYNYDEWYGMKGNQCIMIGITEKDECFEEIREKVENYGK